MKNLDLKLVALLCSMLFLRQGFAVEKEEPIRLRGKSLFTFEQDHFIFETDKAYFKIDRKGLSKGLLNKFENSTLNDKEIEFEISSKKLKYSWPVTISTDDSNLQIVNNNKTVTSINEKNGLLNLEGKLMVSFSDEDCLIQVKDTVYQFKKSVLTQNQNEQLRLANIGSNVKLSIPKESVNYSWSFAAPVTRNIASIDEPDETIRNKSYMELTGTVLYSANQNTIAVQSKDSIYHVKRRNVITPKPELLDIHGSKVKLIIPTKDIEFTWAATNTKFVENRKP